MTSDHARETVKTMDRLTVQEEYSMTSKHEWEIVETIDRSTVRERGPFSNFRTQWKNTKLDLYKVSGNEREC